MQWSRPHSCPIRCLGPSWQSPCQQHINRCGPRTTGQGALAPSRLLQPAIERPGPQLRYSAFNRELLGVHLSVKHFLYYVEGQTFTIFTDHKPLVNAIKMKSETQSPRQARQLSSISEYSTDIQHVAGKANVIKFLYL